MDEVTRAALESASERHPCVAITFTHQFLDGTEGRACGFVPNDWDGTTVVRFTGPWWR